MKNQSTAVGVNGSYIFAVFMCLTNGAWAVTSSDLEECEHKQGEEAILTCYRRKKEEAKKEEQAKKDEEAKKDEAKKPISQ